MHVFAYRFELYGITGEVVARSIGKARNIVVQRAKAAGYVRLGKGYDAYRRCEVVRAPARDGAPVELGQLEGLVLDAWHVPPRLARLSARAAALEAKVEVARVASEYKQARVRTADLRAAELEAENVPGELLTMVLR